MLIALFGLRVVLAVVFTAAALGKLRDVAGFAGTLSGFGIDDALRRPVAVAVPLAELMTAGLLLVPATAPVGASLAAALLAVFSLAVGAALGRGNAPECACFGSAASETIGVHSLLRNAVLAAMTVAVFVGSRVAPDDPTADPSLGVGVTVLAGLLAVAAWDASRLRATNRALLTRVTALEARVKAQAASADTRDLGAGGLPRGTPAPPFDLVKLEGDRASLGSLVAAGRPLALVFVSAHCPVCHELWPDIERWQSAASQVLTVAVVGSGSEHTLELKLMGHQVANVLLEGNTRLAEAYALSLKPSAVVVGTDGRIASASVAGVGAIRALIAEHVQPLST